MAKFTITNNEVLASVDALAALDRADDKGKPVYTFSSIVRLALAKKKRRLALLADDCITARTALLRQFDVTGARNPDGSPKDDPANIKAYNAEAEPLFAAKITFEMAPLKYDDLTNGDKNNIPVGVISTLLWLLDEKTEDAEGAE